MTRKDFLKVSSLLGVSLPLQSSLMACGQEGPGPSDFMGEVLIIGAGPAGMASGYLLAQKGIDFQILEAGPTYGGRIKHTRSFVDFPISLGAEWLHVPAGELPAIVNDPSRQITTRLKEYELQDQMGHYQNGELKYYTIRQAEGKNVQDQKFIDSSWLDFFEEYLLPGIDTRMTFNTQVVSINYESNRVVVTDSTGVNYEADKVIVTVPLKILQQGRVTFSPELPDAHRKAIQEANIWGGFKAFIECTEKYYPAYLTFPDSETREGQRLYYDAAYGQESPAHVMGLFAVGKQAEPYQALTGDAQRDYILQELDEVFDGAASRTYIKHLVQNWNEEPHIGAAYLADHAASNISRRLSRSVNDKVYFAGSAYTRENDWSSVHMAARSARDAVDEIT